MTTSETMDGLEQSRMVQGTRRKWINKYVSIAMFMSVRKQGIHGKEPKGREVGCEMQTMVRPCKNQLLFCYFYPIRGGTKIAKGSKEGWKGRWWSGGEHLSKDDYFSQICCFPKFSIFFCT